MLKDLFRSKQRYVTVRPGQAVEPAPGHEPATPREVPDGLWTKCEACGNILYNKELARDLHVCAKCGHHFRVGSRERLAQILDADTFQEFDHHLTSLNPLAFPNYEDKVARSHERTGLSEAVLTGEGVLDGMPVAVGVLDFGFFSGSMGSVVGEKVTRVFERARERDLPVIMVSGGGGGARMQEGILSLMQMAKTSQAVHRFGEGGRPYFSVLTDPTMAGVYASFASLGDVVLAEPGALIGFAGPRIVEKTIRQPLPAGFQSAEFALKHGMLDMIVERKSLASTLSRLLHLHGCNGRRGA